MSEIFEIGVRRGFAPVATRIPAFDVYAITRSRCGLRTQRPVSFYKGTSNSLPRIRL